jgi:Zn-dependent protease
MLEIYLISSVVCIVLILIVGKKLDGYITVRDLLKSIIFGFIPFLNIMVLCLLLSILGDEPEFRNILNKKVF